MSKLRIFLVDDHNLFRNGLKLLLNATGLFEVSGEAADGREFLEKLEEGLPDIVLMDIDMPLMDGVEATRSALDTYPGLKIITLSMFGEEEYYYKMIDAGVKGFLLKNSEILEVKKAILSVHGGGTYFSPELLYNVVRKIREVTTQEGRETNLSEREVEVLAEICKGLSNQEIADHLNISKRTVDKHRSNLLEKTGSKNTANLIMHAIRNKLIDL